VVLNELSTNVLYSLFPILIWTMASLKSKVYVEPLVSLIYARFFGQYRDSEFCEITSRPMRSSERWDAVHLLTKIYLKEAKHTTLAA
jgi:hypothetical protein